MKVYILYSYGYEDQTNIEAFMEFGSAEALLNKCSTYELNNPEPIWNENDQEYDDHEKIINRWIKKHPAKQLCSAGIGFRIEELNLVE